MSEEIGEAVSTEGCRPETAPVPAITALPAWTGGGWQQQHDFDREGLLSIIGNVDGPDDGQYHYTRICEVEDNDDGIANATLIAASPKLADAAASVLACVDAHAAWIALGFPARNLVEAPDRKAAEKAMGQLRAAYAEALGQ